MCVMQSVLAAYLCFRHGTTVSCEVPVTTYSALRWLICWPGTLPRMMVALKARHDFFEQQSTSASNCARTASHSNHDCSVVPLLSLDHCVVLLCAYALTLS